MEFSHRYSSISSLNFFFPAPVLARFQYAFIHYIYFGVCYEMGNTSSGKDDELSRKRRQKGKWYTKIFEEAE